MNLRNQMWRESFVGKTVAPEGRGKYLRQKFRRGLILADARMQGSHNRSARPCDEAGIDELRLVPCRLRVLGIALFECTYQPQIPSHCAVLTRLG
jgi:hypothetical protein